MCLPFLTGSIVQAIRQLQNGAPTDKRFLVVVANINVKNVHRPVERCATLKKILDHSIPTPLLTREYHIHNASLCPICALVATIQWLEPTRTNNPVVEPLGTPFDATVAIQHVENTIVAVQSLVLCLQLLVDLVIGGVVEGVDLRLGD